MSRKHPMMDMLRIMMPYLSPGMRPLVLELCIMNEMQSTIRYYNHCLKTCDRKTPASNIPKPTQIVKELEPFLDQEQSKQLHHMIDMMDMLEMLKEFNELNETGKEAAHNTDSFAHFAPDPELLKTFLSKEQLDMLSTFQAFSNQQNKTN